MTNVHVPDSESARLATLNSYGILDTLPEKSYDDLVAIAAGICDAPMGSVALIDAERKWVKSQLGFTMSQIPRRESFGAHAILRPHEILVVPDALADERFLNNPLVSGDHKVRFYAGAPLIASGGAAVGTLCVMDRTPRELAPFQIEALTSLSRQVVNLLELGLAHRNLTSHLSEREWYENQLLQHQRELLAENAQLTEASRTDVLTGLLNRRAFIPIIKRAINSAEIECSPLSMAIVDIDNFKLINDRHGHPAGDKVLISVAEALKFQCGDRNPLARIGGEEFAIVLEGADIANAIRQCEQMRATIESLPHNFRLTVSIGVAALRIGDVVSSLYTRADEALYEAKRGGRNQVASFT